MKSLALLACLLLSSVTAMPAEGQPPAERCALAVDAGWIRLSPMPMPMLAGFAVLRNDCAQPVTVVAASSPAFGDVELHESTLVDGVSRMRAVPRLRIGAGESAVLKPGGLHLMLMQPVSAPKSGDRIEVVFTLDDGRRMRGMFAARQAGSR